MAWFTLLVILFVVCGYLSEKNKQNDGTGSRVAKTSDEDPRHDKVTEEYRNNPHMRR